MNDTPDKAPSGAKKAWCTLWNFTVNTGRRLQILGRYDADGTWIPVPRSEILVDPDTTSRAGHLALDVLLGR